METTALYAELIIIGLETSIWLGAIAAILTDLKICGVLKYFLEKTPAAIFLLGILYVIGLTMDRIADILFLRLEKKIRKSTGLMSSSSILIWTRAGQENYFTYTRSRIRLLRASAINFSLITLSASFFAWSYMGDTILFCIFVPLIGSVFSAFSFWGYRKMVSSFYDKAKILEADLLKNENNSNTGATA